MSEAKVGLIIFTILMAIFIPTAYHLDQESRKESAYIMKHCMKWTTIHSKGYYSYCKKLK